MNKSLDVSQDVWEAAEASFQRYISPLPDAFDQFNTALIVEGIAYAIMDERERAVTAYLELARTNGDAAEQCEAAWLAFVRGEK